MTWQRRLCDSLIASAFGLALACAGGANDQPPTGAPDQPPTGAPIERPSLTAEECASKGGTEVGDIGDGAIHRPDYRCPDDQPPLGTIKAPPDGPVAIEGSVCCPPSQN